MARSVQNDLSPDAQPGMPLVRSPQMQVAQSDGIRKTSGKQHPRKTEDDDDDDAAGWLNPNGAQPADPSAAEAAADAVGTRVTTTGHAAGMNTGTTGAAHAAGHEAGALSAGGNVAGSAASNGTASNVWASAPGKVGAVVGGALVVAAMSGGGGGIGNGAAAPQGVTPPPVPDGTDNTVPDVPSGDDEHSGAGEQHAAPPLASTPQNQPQPEGPPRYDTSTPQGVTHDASIPLDASVFIGKGAPPAFIRISRITANDASADAPALVLNQGTPEEKTLKVGDVIAREEFDRISWNARANTGGSFGFEALDAERQPFAGMAEQVIEIREAPAAPDYPANRPVEHIHHDYLNALSPTLFTGNDTNKTPDVIRITAIAPSKPTSAEPALVLHAGTPQEVPLQVGMTIDRSQFEQVSWNTANNEGGSFSFAVVDASGNAIPGSTPQTVVLSEMPANAPIFRSVPVLYPTPHDILSTMDASVLLGDDFNRHPHAIRIESISALGSDSTDALKFDRDVTGTQPWETVKVGDVFTPNELPRMHWFPENNNGGRFSFSSLDAQGEKIPGVPIQTVIIHESPEPPTYPAGHKTQVPLDSIQSLSSTLFSGTGVSPAFVRITELQIDGNVPDANTPAPLLFDKDGAGGANPVPVQLNQIISETDFDKLLWDSQHATSGTITFEVLDADRLPIIDPIGYPITQDVKIEAHDAAPNAPAGRAAEIPVAQEASPSTRTAALLDEQQHVPLI
ncbi:MAG: hypothetical protein Q4D19_07925 [Lautropia sp.]|nr:hypothetical protein [Lautropia sp.]